MTTDTQSRESETELTWKDAATVEGDHRQVADMAVTLANAGKNVRVSRDNFTSTVHTDKDYEVKHYDNRSLIIRDSGTVACTVYDDSSLYISEPHE